MMLAPCDKDTRSLRKGPTNPVATPLTVAASIADFDPFALEEDDKAKGKAKTGTKAGKKQKASKQQGVLQEDSSESEQPPRRTKRSSLSTGRTPSSRRITAKENPKAGSTKKTAKESRQSLESKSEHLPKRESVNKLKEKRRAVSSRNLLGNSMKSESSKKDRISVVKRGKTKSLPRDPSSAATPSSRGALKKDTKKDPLSVDSKNGQKPSPTKRTKIRRTKTSPDNPAAWEMTKEEARPKLVRSNSLDSRLGDLDKAEDKKKATAENSLKKRTSSSHKKSASNRNLQSKSNTKNRKPTKKDPLSLDSKSEHKALSATKRTLRVHRAKTTVEDTNGERPPLVRSNSLDGKLDDLTVSDDSERHSGNKQEAREHQPSLIDKRRNLLATKRALSRRSLVDKKSIKDPLATASDHVRQSRRGRSGSRRSSQGVHLNAEVQEDATAFPIQKGLMRSNSVDSRRDPEPEKEDAATNPQGPPRSMGFRRSAMGGTNHALKMFMERTVKEETAAENLKNSKLEKLSSIKKEFQSNAREQSKFTDAVMARKSALGLVPRGLSRTLSLSHIAHDPALGAHESLLSTSNVPVATSSAAKTTTGRGPASINDMAKRMQDLGTSFRLSKRQLMGDTNQPLTKGLTGAIPLLMTTRPGALSA